MSPVMPLQSMSFKEGNWERTDVRDAQIYAKLL